ncbi:MAG: SurA N-terminal domain-containing protein [Kiritimatiellae bacterium]|nr:SurA N-terminal domain-containing protein [Kiritimatiellia bacterium]
MLITKFNKLIRNKVIWGIFAIIVGGSFAFGGMLSKWGDKSGKADKRQGSVGSLFGENVSRQDFLTARFYELGLRSNPDLTPEQNEILSDRTWKRLAALQSAQNIGLSASSFEVATTIQQDSTFHVNGVFDKNTYLSLITSQLQVPIATFENYIRQELLIRKVMNVMQSMSWISPSELTKRLDDISDLFVVETGNITAKQLTKDVEVSVDDAKEFFTENKEQFRVPEKVSVYYISIPISNYLASVKITDEMVSEYYDKNISDYSSTNALEEPTPLAEVRDDITVALTGKQSVFLARDDATEIVMAMAPGRYNVKGMSMQEVAKNKKLEIKSTDLFSAYEVLEGISAGGAFNQAAFKLDKDDPELSFSDPITGTEYIYIISVKEQAESRLPTFEEVDEVVMISSKQAATEKALAEKAQEIHDAVQNSLMGGTTFTAAMQEYNINVSTSATFSVYENSQQNSAIPQQLLQHVMVLQQGEITEPVDTMLGTTIAHVTSRAHGDLATAQLLRPQLMSTIGRYRSNLIYSDWGDYILAKADFQDFSKIDDNE